MRLAFKGQFLEREVENFPFRWWAESDSDWLMVEPASGIGKSRIIVRVDASGLDRGQYKGFIYIYCPDAANSPLPIKGDTNIF